MMARLYPETQQTGGINTPPVQNFDTPAMEGSMQQFLADNLGQYVVVEFLVGTQTMTTKAGILYAVGTSVMTLYQELSQTFVTCDIFSVKFVTFYLPGHRPWQVPNPMFGQNGTGGLPGSMGQWPVPGALPSQNGAAMPPSGMPEGMGYPMSPEMGGDVGAEGQWSGRPGPCAGCGQGRMPTWG